MEIAEPEAVIGAKVEVYQPDEDQWSTGRIERYYPDNGWMVQYYDGESTWLPSLQNVQIMEEATTISSARNSGGPLLQGLNDEDEEDEYEDCLDDFEASSPVQTQQDALREIIDGGESDLNEFDEYLLSHPHGDETLLALDQLQHVNNAGSPQQPLPNEHESKFIEDNEAGNGSTDNEIDEDCEHTPMEENNAVIAVRIFEINDMFTLASEIQNPRIRILFAESPPEQANTRTATDSAFRCKSLLFTTEVGVTADINALEWVAEDSNSFAFEAIMQDGPVEESLFGDLILALHGDTSIGNQQLVADTCIHLKDVLRNGETKLGESLVKVSVKTSLPMKQRIDRKTTDGIIHFEIHIYFQRSRLMMQHRPALEPPKAPRPRSSSNARPATSKELANNRKPSIKKQPPRGRQQNHVELQRRNMAAKRQRAQASLLQQNARHMAKVNNTPSHLSKLLGKPKQSRKANKGNSKTIAPGKRRHTRSGFTRPSGKSVMLEEPVKAAFHDPAALAACILQLRKSVSELEQSSRFTRVKLQKLEALNDKKQKQLAQVPAVSTKVLSNPSISVSGTLPVDYASIGQDDVEFRELKTTNDMFTATRQALAEKIGNYRRRYENSSQAYDTSVAQLKLAKRRIKQMVAANKNLNSDNDDTPDGNRYGDEDLFEDSDEEDVKFIRLHKQSIALKAEIEALSQFQQIANQSPEHEYEKMQLAAAKLQSQLLTAQQRLKEAHQKLEHFTRMSEEYNSTQLYEKWRKCVAAMRAITTKCDREERLHAITKQIEDVDPSYRQASWQT